MASIGTLTAFLGMDVRNLKKGAGEAKSTLKGVESGLGELKAAAGAVGAALAFNELKKLYLNFEKSAAAVAQMNRALESTKASHETAVRAQEALTYSSLKLGHSTTSVAEAMTSLITKSQDAEAAVQDFGLVEDVAAKFNMDLGSGVDVVAKAMSGQFRSLAQLLPYMKKWASEHKDLAGTAKGAKMALEELNRVAGGEAVKKAATAIGQIERLHTIQGKIGGQIGRLLTGSDDTSEAWKSIADSAERFLRAMQSVKGAPVIQNLAKWAAGIGYMVSGDFLHPGESRSGAAIDKSLYANYTGKTGTVSSVANLFPGLPSSALASGVMPGGEKNLLASQRAGAEDTSEADAKAAESAKARAKALRDANVSAYQDILAQSDLTTQQMQAAWAGMDSARLDQIEAEKTADLEAGMAVSLADERMQAKVIALWKEEEDAWTKLSDDKVAKSTKVLAAQVSAYDEMLSSAFLTVDEMTAVWDKYKAARLKQIDEEVAAQVKAANLSPADAAALRFKLTTEMNRKGNESFANRTGMEPDAEAQSAADNWVKIADDGFKSIGEAASGFFTTAKGQWADFHQSLSAMLANFVGTVLKQIADQALGSGPTGSIGASIVDLFSRGGNAKNVATDVSWAMNPMDLKPVASGGIFRSPTPALIGESGPEAVIPLSRFRDASFMDRLAGTGTDGPGSRAQGRPVIINIQTADPQAFKASSSQIAARMALAVRQAERNL